jgi:TonB-linked SusC/RagA family outer membrane protein
MKKTNWLNHLKAIIPKMSLSIRLITLFFISLFLFQANIFAQSNSLSIVMNNVDLIKVIKEIEKKSDYNFLYRPSAINLKQKVSVNVKNVSISKLLKELFAKSGIDYRINEKQIVLKPKDSNEGEISTIVAKPIKIKGNITDENGISLPGATIVEEGTSKGTTSDTDGNFTINVANTFAVLKVSYIGFTTQLIPVKNQTFITVVMEESASSLNEVVITGVFKKRKTTYTGAVKTITAKQLKKYGNRNIIATLNKIDPSFNIIENNEFGSDPNRLPEINVRGTTSLPTLTQIQNNEKASNLNTPLIILDGFEISLQRMMDLNIYEVENITILKDASATAIYGSKGANGIIVITRKAPKLGKLNITYSSNINLQFPDLNSYHLLNAREKLALELKAGYYNHKNAESKFALMNLYYTKLKLVEQGINTDWMSKPLQTGIGQSHYLNLNGGSEAFRYSASLNYNHIAGVMKKSSRSNFNGSINLTYSYKNVIFTNALSIGLNKSKNSPFGDFSTYVKLNPYWHPYDENGELVKRFGYFKNLPFNKIVADNSLYNALLSPQEFTTDYFDVNNNFFIKWNVLKGFTIESIFGISKNINNSDNFIPANNTLFEDEKQLNKKGTYEYSTGNDFKYDFRFNLNYSKLIANQHLIFCGFSSNISENTSYTYNISASGFPSKKMNFFGAALKFTNKSPSGKESISRMVSIAANFNYSFDNRYFIDLVYNLNGSSQFGSNSRFAPFWSAGIGWNLHHENFLKNSEFINRLKIRGSYGSSGSQQFDTYQAISKYKYFMNRGYEGALGNYLKGIANKDLKWQQTYQYNIGIDAELLNKSITINANVYYKTTSNLISPMNLPLSNGFSSYIENIGEIENKGFDFSIQVYFIKNKANNFYWSVGGSLAYNQDKIIKLSDAVIKQNEETKKTNTNNTSPINLYFVGKSISGLYVVRSLGIDPSTGKELFLKKNGEITRDWDFKDVYYAGVQNPTFNGNMNTDLVYGNFSMSVSFGFHWGGVQYNRTLIDRVENADKKENVDRRVYDDRWKEPGDKTFFKGINETGETKYSSRFVQNDIMFECDNINLSYRIDRNDWMKKNFGMQSLNFTLNMGNIFYFSSIKRERGLTYPFSHQITFSIQATF